MSFLRQSTLSLAIATLSVVAWAQTDAEHAQHHPGATPSAATTTAAASAPTKVSDKESMAKMNSTMKSMRTMHEKMMAAKTPAERNALMAEHMKAMQSGMAMMRDMAAMGDMQCMQGMDATGTDTGKSAAPKDMKAHHDQMQMRMDMMTSMMEMMMDRMPAAATN